jgi:hypothetical protein
MPFHHSATPRGRVSRRSILAAAPAGVFAGLTASASANASASARASMRGVLAQPTAADPVSFYLGQVLALATLQAQAVRRLRPLLAAPATNDAGWLSGSSAEAGVIGAVASVLGAMEPPPELAASIGELRLASTAYQEAVAATRVAAAGDPAAATAASNGLTTGASHILLWLDALTAETGNDWGDGLRTLTEAEVAAAPAALPATTPAPAAASQQEVVDVPETEAPAAEAPAEASADETAEERRARRKAERQAAQEEEP